MHSCIAVLSGTIQTWKRSYINSRPGYCYCVRKSSQSVSFLFTVHGAVPGLIPLHRQLGSLGVLFGRDMFIYTNQVLEQCKQCLGCAAHTFVWTSLFSEKYASPERDTKDVFISCLRRNHSEFIIFSPCTPLCHIIFLCCLLCGISALQILWLFPIK